jgi:WD repeat-containing protein 81
MEQEELQSCFECLKRRINSDFSDKLIFSYALSDSAFPFASSAVVQVLVIVIFFLFLFLIFSG